MFRSHHRLLVSLIWIFLPQCFFTSDIIRQSADRGISFEDIRQGMKYFLPCDIVFVISFVSPYEFYLKMLFSLFHIIEFILYYIRLALGTKVKQADVILLGYPLLYNVSSVIKRRDLNIYEKVTILHRLGSILLQRSYACRYFLTRNLKAFQIQKPNRQIKKEFIFTENHSFNYSTGLKFFV